MIIIAYRCHALTFLLALCVSFFASATFAQTRPLKTNKDYVDIVIYLRYLNPDSALYYVKAGLEKAEREKDYLGKAALLNQFGMIEDNATNTENSRQKYKEAESIYRQHKDVKGLATVLIRLAGVERKKGNNAKSLNYIVEASKLSEQIDDALGMLEARVAYAQTYYFLEDYERLINQLEIAKKIDQRLPVSNVSMDMYIHFAAAYNNLKQPDSAIAYATLGLKKSTETKYNGQRVTLFQALGVAYAGKGDTANAKAMLKKALALAVAINNLPRQQTTLIELANVYENQPDSAIVFLKQALVLASSLKKDRQRIRILDKMSAVYKRKGNFEQALKVKEQSTLLAEQVYYTDVKKQVISLEAAYELEKSKTKLKELTIRHTKQTHKNNIIIAIAIAIGLILVFTLIYYYRARDLNTRLTVANNKLAASNDEKDKFFSIVAHDIRSPIASTIGVLRMIADRELDEETQLEVVNKLAIHCESSLEVLDKLLRWGQLQIKGTSLNITKFNPLHNIDQNVALLHQAALDKDIAISTYVPENFSVKADSNHFDFVVRNLLANAIKFTPLGGAVKIVADAESPNVIRFRVIDNGVGIPPKRIENLFKLSGTSTQGTSAEAGTSLGLLICKEFIVANNGTLKVQSEVGKGTTFEFTLPRAEMYTV